MSVKTANPSVTTSRSGNMLYIVHITHTHLSLTWSGSLSSPGACSDSSVAVASIFQSSSSLLICEAEIWRALACSLSEGILTSQLRKHLSWINGCHLAGSLRRRDYICTSSVERHTVACVHTNINWQRFIQNREIIRWGTWCHFGWESNAKHMAQVVKLGGGNLSVEVGNPRAPTPCMKHWLEYSPFFFEWVLLEARMSAEQYHHSFFLSGDESQHENILSATVVALQHRLSKEGVPVEGDFLVSRAHQVVDNVAKERKWYMK